MPCNISKDFKTNLHSYGVCHTFNGEPEQMKYVENTATGLSLVLNVEQYEHMRGPQNDAGLKVSRPLIRVDAEPAGGVRGLRLKPNSPDGSLFKLPQF